MRKLAIGMGVAMAVALIGAPAAQAASTSVVGTGSYEKLVVNNGNANLVFKVFAPGGECEIKYLRVEFRDRDGSRYQIDGGCYPGGVWAASLVSGGSIIECPGFTLTYDASRTVWTGKIPRSCLTQLAGAVKVTKSYVDDYSPNINEVPATKYVARG